MRLWLCLMIAAGAANAQRRTFDVASVKLVEQEWLQTSPSRSGGRITWSTDLRYIVGYAFRLQPPRISGAIPGSQWIYRIEATMKPDATDSEVREMFQALLAERFRMRWRRETHEADGYVLTVAKGGFRLKAGEGDGRIVSTLQAAGLVRMRAEGATLQALAERLERDLESPVLDRTGTAGAYSFDVRYSRADGVALAEAPYLFDAPEGMRAQARKTEGPGRDAGGRVH